MCLFKEVFQFDLAHVLSDIIEEEWIITYNTVHHQGAIKIQSNEWIRMFIYIHIFPFKVVGAKQM